MSTHEELIPPPPIASEKLARHIREGRLLVLSCASQSAPPKNAIVSPMTASPRPPGPRGWRHDHQTTTPRGSDPRRCGHGGDRAERSYNPFYPAGSSRPSPDRAPPALGMARGHLRDRHPTPHIGTRNLSRSIPPVRAKSWPSPVLEARRRSALGGRGSPPMKPQPTVSEIADDLRRVVEPGMVVELRILGAIDNPRYPTFVVSGYYDHDHLDELAKAAVEWTAKAEGCYVTINPVSPDLLARAANRVVRKPRHTTVDAEIPRRIGLVSTPTRCDQPECRRTPRRRPRHTSGS